MPLEWIRIPQTEKTYSSGAFSDALSAYRDAWIKDLSDIRAGEQYWTEWFAAKLTRGTAYDPERPLFYSWQPLSSDAVISMASPEWETIMVANAAAALHLAFVDHGDPFAASNASHYLRACACYARAATECHEWTDVPATVQSVGLESYASINDAMDVMCDACARVCVAYAQPKDGAPVTHWSNIYWKLSMSKPCARASDDGAEADSLLISDFESLTDIALFEACARHGPAEHLKGNFMESVALLRKASEIGERLPCALVNERRLHRLNDTLGNYEHVLRQVLRIHPEDDLPFSEKMLPVQTQMPRRTVVFP